MASPFSQQAVSFQASGSHEPRLDTSDTVHHGSTSHCFPPLCQYREDSFNQTLDFEALPSHSSFTPSCNPPPWNTQVGDHPYFLNSGPVFPTSSITSPPLPTTSLFPPHADQYVSGWFQDLAMTPIGDFPSPQEVIHQGQSSVYDTFSSVWDENRPVSGQMAPLQDRVDQYTFCFESRLLESCAAEDASFPPNETMTPHLDTLPIGSKRKHTRSGPVDESQSKRTRRSKNTPVDVSTSTPGMLESGSMSYTHPPAWANPLSPPPTEEVESIPKFKKGNRCGHNGCGKWHADPSTVSRHRRAHVDRYPCPNPDCEVISTTYRALKRHWENRVGRCSAYERKRVECLVKGDVNIEAFDPKIHLPYKSLKLRRGKHVK